MAATVASVTQQFRLEVPAAAREAADLGLGASMLSTKALLQQPLWDPRAYPDNGSAAEKLRVSYQRARSIAQHVKMTVADVAGPSPKFWAFHRDYIATADTAATIILGIHWNLAMGTIAAYAPQRPDLAPLLRELEAFESFGDFMLTEVGHGLDARRLETTATRLPNGCFDLHTPHPGAAKAMPPTTPEPGVARVAVVFAQLVVDGDRRGVRPFVVRINGPGGALAAGVSCRPLPPQPGPRHLDHAITSFRHVRIGPGALLGGLERPADPRRAFFRAIHRITYGGLAFASTNAAMLRVSAYIVGRYSQQREVQGVPIIAFSTQHTPILRTLTVAAVLDALADEACRAVMALREHAEVQNGLVCAFKQFAMHHAQVLSNELMHRCGWQGLYAHNQMAGYAAAIRGSSIAEGDTLVLCIRLACELVLGRYALPAARDPSTLLAQYERGVWAEAAELRASWSELPGPGVRVLLNTHILPRARSLVHATGQRMAYEAAAAAPSVTPAMLRFFEASCVADDPSWFVQHLGMTREAVQGRLADAVAELLPELDDMLRRTGAEPWATAPILGRERWQAFVQGLAEYKSPSARI